MKPASAAKSLAGAARHRLGWLLTLAAAAVALAEPVDFNLQIRPLLADRCFACHGPDEASRKAQVRLDTREGALAADTGWPQKPLGLGNQSAG